MVVQLNVLADNETVVDKTEIQHDNVAISIDNQQLVKAC